MIMCVCVCVCVCVCLRVCACPHSTIDAEHVQNATLAGGVIMGAACDMILNQGVSVLAGTHHCTTHSTVLHTHFTTTSTTRKFVLLGVSVLAGTLHCTILHTPLYYTPSLYYYQYDTVLHTRLTSPESL